MKLSPRDWDGVLPYRAIGDNDQVIQVLPKVRELVDMTFRLLLDGQTFKIIRRKLPDGSVVRVQVWDDDLLGRRAYAEIVIGDELGGAAVDLLYEAGLIDVVNEGGGAYSAGLYIGDEIVAQWTPTADLNGSGTIDADDRLFPLGLVSWTGDYPVVGDIDPTTYTTAPSRVCTTDLRKLAARYTPASSWGGKLRLWAQSIYGVQRSDYSLGGGLFPGLVLNGITIDYDGTGSAWLLTTDDYSYFLVRPTLTENQVTLSVYPLVSLDESSPYDAWRQWALGELQTQFAGQAADRADLNKGILETLVLCWSTVGPLYATVDAGTLSPTWPLGSPLACGWDSNWDGSEARIVLLTTDLNSYGVAGQELMVAVTSEQVSGAWQFSAAASITRGVAGLVDNEKLRAWVPLATYDVSSGTHLSDLLYFCGTDTGGDVPSPPSDFAALPVYGYYSSADIWKPALWSRERTSANIPGESAGNRIICHGESYSRVVLGSGYNDAIVETLSIGSESVTVVHQGTVSFSNQFAEIVPGSTSLYYDQMVYHGYGAYTDCTDGPWPGMAYEDTQGSKWVEFIGGVGNSREISPSQYTSNGQIVIVIPHGIRDAIVLGTRTSSSVYSSSLTVCDSVSLSPDGRKYTGVYYYNSTNGNATPGDPVSWDGESIRGDTTLYSLNWSSGVTTQTGASAQEEANVRLISGTGIVQIASWTEHTGTNPIDTTWEVASQYVLPSPYGSSSGSSDDWAAFFDAPYGVCTSGVRDVELVPAVIESALTAARIGKGTPSGISSASDGGYPSGDSFVGWA
jgi:hypothetical protein